MLTDNHGRTINYLRLAVTDRCNLRCFYCMPEHGLDWLGREQLMTYGEMLRICRLALQMGVDKIRITGGEPFVRKGLIGFMADIARLDGLRELTMTTNGVLTAPYIPELKKMGVRTVNLSLDTLDRDRFHAITHRDELPAVLHTLEELLRHGMNVKINAVVMKGKNTEDIIPLTMLARERQVSIRFIEEMPFNGGSHASGQFLDHLQILGIIRDRFPDIYKIQDPAYATASSYHIPGFRGDVGIIAAYTRSFCGTCNRLRITAEGVLKTCLYDDGVLNIRDMLRTGADDDKVQQALLGAIAHREASGWDAEKRNEHEFMARIGG